MEDLPRAIDAYSNALTCQKDYPDAYNNMGYALLNLGKVGPKCDYSLCSDDSTQPLQKQR